MSHTNLNGTRTKVTIHSVQKMKRAGSKISVVTCYDAAFARLIEASRVDAVLVGDSLGNVILGFDSTIPVTIDHMVHHTAAVSRRMVRPLLIADMPFLTYSNSEQALRNAGRLIQEGGAHAVKLEGGQSVLPQIKAIVQAGIPVMGHLGLTPQSVHALGGYKVQAKSGEEQHALLKDALDLQAAGVFAIVLEMVPATIAKKISEQLTVPVIGIGAGPDCDGQVLVLHDLLGFDAQFSPKFLKKYADLSSVVAQALDCYDDDVKGKTFPTEAHSF